MKMVSLENIISLENELYEQEVAEKKKAADWLEEQERQVMQKYRGEVLRVDKKKETIARRAEEKARRKAEEKLQSAEACSAKLESLDDEYLHSCLAKHMKSITG